MFKKVNEREKREINAGSMADIAFLLLIFFLVTTTIAADAGIQVKLPPYEGKEPISQPIKKRNLFAIKVNKDDLILARKQEMSIANIRENAKRFILNYGKDPNLSERPTKAVISLQNDRSTSYHAYLSVYNEVKAAYNEIWEAKAQEHFRHSYESLSDNQKKIIQKEIPLVISEAEPFEF